MIAIPLIFIGHQTIPVGYANASDGKDTTAFLSAGIFNNVALQARYF
jgi:hypothetical protein